MKIKLLSDTSTILFLKSHLPNKKIQLMLNYVVLSTLITDTTKYIKIKTESIKAFGSTPNYPYLRFSINTEGIGTIQIGFYSVIHNELDVYNKDANPKKYIIK